MTCPRSGRQQCCSTATHRLQAQQAGQIRAHDGRGLHRIAFPSVQQRQRLGKVAGDLRTQRHVLHSVASAQVAAPDVTVFAHSHAR